MLEKTCFKVTDVTRETVTKCISTSWNDPHVKLYYMSKLKMPIFQGQKSWILKFKSESQKRKVGIVPKI